MRNSYQRKQNCWRVCSNKKVLEYDNKNVPPFGSRQYLRISRAYQEHGKLKRRLVKETG